MARGEFTVEEARKTICYVDDLLKLIPDENLGQALRPLADIFLFLRAAEKVAPHEKKG